MIKKNKELFEVNDLAVQLAELLLQSCDEFNHEEFPILSEFLNKSFAERVLWLEDRSREQLNEIIFEYNICRKCKNKENF